VEKALFFSDFIDIQKWQKVQDHFSEVLSMPLRTVDQAGVLLTKPSSSFRLCEEINSTSLEGVMRCNGCLPPSLPEEEKRWQEGYSCPLVEMQIYSIPLKIDKKTFGYIIAGPVLVGKARDPETYKKAARKLGIDPERYLDAMRETRLFSHSRMYSAITLLHDIGQYICDLAYHNSKLKEIVPDAPGVFERVQDFYTERLLDALLKVSFKYTNADRGSIMLIDEKTQELYIKVSQGLAKEIVNSARLKMGQGIAGLAAQEKRPIFINKNTAEDRIQKLLRNPAIKYSIIIPIIVNEKVLGVLNVGSSEDATGRFTTQSVETVDKLIDLVEATLTN